MSEEQAGETGGDAASGVEDRRGVVIGILVAVLVALVVFFVAHAAG